MSRIVPLFLFIFFFAPLAKAQTLYSVLEKSTIALGEPNTYKVRIDQTGGKVVESAPKGELLPFHFEEISDSIVFKGDHYERIITFTVFEEGEFRVPAYEFRTGGKLLKTIPYQLKVINTAQKGDEIHDILPNEKVEFTLADYWNQYKFYLLLLLLLLAIIFIIVQFIRYGKKRKQDPKVRTNETLKALKLLKKKGYIESGDFRSFYVELIDLSRDFLKKQYQIPADVLLTEDLLDYMKLNQTLSLENEQIIGKVFRTGDLVKFAKTFPDQNTMETDYALIESWVKNSKKDLEFENLRTDV